MLRDLIRPYIPKIVKREMTNRELALILNASETHVCRVLKQLNVKREPAKARVSQAPFLEARKAFRTEAANTLTVQEAAKAANCSTRTIYRLKSK